MVGSFGLPSLPVPSPQDAERAAASKSYFGQLSHHARKQDMTLPVSDGAGRDLQKTESLN